MVEAGSTLSERLALVTGLTLTALVTSAMETAATAAVVAVVALIAVDTGIVIVIDGCVVQ